MSKITAFTDLTNVKDLPGLVRFLGQFFRELQPVINGRIEFGDNIRSEQVTTFFPVLNVDKVIEHKLSKLNVNFLVANKGVSCDIYRGSDSNSTSQINLRSTVSGVTVTLILF